MMLTARHGTFKNNMLTPCMQSLLSSVAPITAYWPAKAPAAVVHDHWRKCNHKHICTLLRISCACLHIHMCAGAARRACARHCLLLWPAAAAAAVTHPSSWGIYNGHSHMLAGGTEAAGSRSARQAGYILDVFLVVVRSLTGV
jgi:hypothetical protein